jgi:chaperonin GroEL (HSP60 family)
VIITNDGATILKSIQALHPAAKMASPLYTFLSAETNI